jgi:hypothetical protein
LSSFRRLHIVSVKHALHCSSFVTALNLWHFSLPVNYNILKQQVILSY